MQKGFSIVSAVFILVILALAGGFAVNLSTSTSVSSELSIDATRAYFASKSGLEWGIFQVVNNPSACPPTTTLNFTQGGLRNFSTQVSCTSTNFTESSSNFNLFSITSTASRGTLSDYDYITRTLVVTAMISNNP